MRAAKSPRFRRAKQRGAAMVEAIIVIVFFILSFTGLVFFHKLYLSKVRTTRISRAATLHDAIIGCKGDVRAELAAAGGSSSVIGGHLPNNVSYGESPGADMSSVASSAAGSQSGVSSSLGAKIVHITNDGKAAAIGGGESYKAKTDSTSFVGCSDPVDDNQFDDIIPRVTSAITL